MSVERFGTRECMKKMKLSEYMIHTNICRENEVGQHFTRLQACYSLRLPLPRERPPTLDSSQKLHRQDSSTSSIALLSHAHLSV
jgi:hypothetical protein